MGKKPHIGIMKQNVGVDHFLVKSEGFEEGIGSVDQFLTLLNDFSEDFTSDVRVRDATVYGE